MRRWDLGLAALLGLTACTETPAAPTVIDEEGLYPKVAPAARNTSVRSELAGGSIQNDQLGAYLDGTAGVVSILQGALGDWELDLTGNKSTRKVGLDFSDPLPGNPGVAPFGSALVKARMIAKASQLTAGSFAGMVGLGSTTLTPLSVSFGYNGKNYAIRMNPANHPGTDWSRVTCQGVVNPAAPSTSACNRWEVVPAGSYGGVVKSIGALEQVTNAAAIPLGNFYFTFSFTITK
jgi:hypothetical protein